MLGVHELVGCLVGWYLGESTMGPVVVGQMPIEKSPEISMIEFFFRTFH